MSPTVAELRDEIRDELGIHENRRGDSGFKSRTFTEIAKAIGCEDLWGGSPSLRKQIRQELAKREADGGLVSVHETDSKPLRKAELVDVRDAIEAENGGEDS